MYTKEQVEKLAEGCSHVIEHLNIPPKDDDGEKMGRGWNVPNRVRTINDPEVTIDWEPGIVFLTTAEDGEWYSDYTYEQIQNATLQGDNILLIDFGDGYSRTLRFITRKPNDTVKSILG